MPLNDTYPDGVVFVCKKDSGGKLRPGGTAFMVSVPGQFADSRYLVTARHNVQDERETWARVRRIGDGPPVDEPIREWLKHPRSDVAIARFDVEVPDTDVRAVPEARFADKWPHGTTFNRGDIVYFIGLLTHVETMAERSVPMVRSGRVGALYQDDIPVQDGNLRRMEPCAHLIDSYSRGGFSGSPCFVEQPTVVLNPAGRPVVGSYLALLGVVVGHFGSPGDNAGVAIITPAEAIRELLNDKEMVDMRQERDEEARKSREDERWKHAAVTDSAAGTSEFEQFEDLTRKLVQVPKSEIDEARKREQG